MPGGVRVDGNATDEDDLVVEQLRQVRDDLPEIRCHESLLPRYRYVNNTSMPKKKLIGVRLDAGLAHELRVYAAEHETTMQAVIEQAVAAKIRRARTTTT